ncbi:hypothetical protein BY996DRAFT_6423087 [Phakopsora pachyrhizi]|nr:hypothetical protein BY996DRAFT_6423087 [Phakopsora pachyrhizi]
MNGTKRSSSNYSRDGSGGGAATVSVTGGTISGTIPLGSITLPLPNPSHSDHLHQHSHGLNIPKPVYYSGETTIVAATASDKSNTDGGLLYNGYYSEVARTTKDEVTPGHMIGLAATDILALGPWASSRSAPLVTKSLATSKRPCFKQ